MEKQILYVKNLNELLTLLKNNPGTQIIGGGTALESLPQKSVSTRTIPELCQVNRHERYIVVGPGATLSDILEIGENHLPQIITQAIKSISNPEIRNISTIGGNICSQNHRSTLYAPLLALDAKIEYKSFTETKSISIRAFDQIPKGFVLSNIKIPLQDSDLSIFRRIGPENRLTQDSASYAFMASIEKNSLISVEMAFAGPIEFQSDELENFLIGKKLPLNQRNIEEIQEIVWHEFQKAITDQMISNEMIEQFLNLSRYSFEQLT